MMYDAFDDDEEERVDEVEDIEFVLDANEEDELRTLYGDNAVDALLARNKSMPHPHHGQYRLLGGPFDGNYVLPESTSKPLRVIITCAPGFDYEKDEMEYEIHYEAADDIGKFPKDDNRRYIYYVSEKYDGDVDTMNEVTQFTLTFIH